MIRFTLPVTPIPLSACYNNAARNGRVKTPRYKAWIADNTKHLMENYTFFLGRKGYARVRGWVAVDIIVKRPDERKRDLDNMLKPVLDLLSSLLIIEDDSRIADLRISYSFLADAYPVVITVKEWGL